MSSEYRRAVLPHFDKLLDDNIMMGTSLVFRDTMQSVMLPHSRNWVLNLFHRSTVRSTVAELALNIWNELSVPQIWRLTETCIRSIHNPALLLTCHNMCLRFLAVAIEALATKQAAQEAIRCLTAILDASVERLEVAVTMHAHALSRTGPAEKQLQEDADIVSIEKERPIGALAFANEKPETVMSCQFSPMHPR
jgi:transformation/transcription domain-associated protein